MDPYALRFLLPHVEEDEWRAVDADWSACIPFFSAAVPVPPSTSSSPSSSSSSDGSEQAHLQAEQQEQQQQRSRAESLMGMMERYSGDSAELVLWYFAPQQLGLRLAVMGSVFQSSTQPFMLFSLSFLFLLSSYILALIVVMLL
jgi:hypothetical protein